MTKGRKIVAPALVLASVRLWLARVKREGEPVLCYPTAMACCAGPACLMCHFRCHAFLSYEGWMRGKICMMGTCPMPCLTNYCAHFSVEGGLVTICFRCLHSYFCFISSFLSLLHCLHLPELWKLLIAFFTPWEKSGGGCEWSIYMSHQLVLNTLWTYK